MNLEKIQKELDKKLEEISDLVNAMSIDKTSEIDLDTFTMIADIHKKKVENYILKNEILFDTTNEVDLDGVDKDRVLDYAFAFGTLYNKMANDKDAIKKFWTREE